MPGAHQNRAWPAANFELAAAEAIITGSPLTIQTSGGPLLVAYRYILQQGAAGNAFIVTRLLLDGVNVPGSTHQVTVPTGLQETPAGFALVEASPGIHELDVRAAGAAAVGDIILAGSGNLIAVELPLWRVEDTIE